MNDTATRSSSLDLHESSSPTGYAGFWRRLLANLVDSAVLLPFAALYWWAPSSRAAALALLPLNALFPVYSVFMHARWGQTLGKMVTGVRVLSIAGTCISWRQAILRDSVGLALTTISAASLAQSLLRVPASTWDHGWAQAALLIGESQPTWGLWARHASTAWFWSEVLVLLFDSKRRALHDFIAGTIVRRTAR